MKLLTILALLVTSTLTFAGPQRDRAQAVMNGLQGSVVTAQQGSIALDAFVDSFPGLIEQLIPLVLTSVCDGVDEEGEVVCTNRLMPKLPVNLTVEEKAKIFNWQVRRWVLRAMTNYQRKQKREELQSSQDSLDAQIAATKVSNL